MMELSCAVGSPIELHSRNLWESDVAMFVFRMVQRGTDIRCIMLVCNRQVCGLQCQCDVADNITADPIGKLFSCIYYSDGAKH